MYLQKLNVDIVERDSLKALALLKVKQNVLKVVPETLKKFNGKKITKRVATAIEEALFKVDQTGYHTYMSDDRQTMYIWGNEISYDHRLQCNLGYKEDIESFNYDKWLNNYGKAYDVTESINNLQEALKDINARVSGYNEALAKFELAKNGLSHLIYN